MPVYQRSEVLEHIRTFSGMLTDLQGTRPNDLVFFYERQRGFHGVYQVLTPPFFDPQDIDGMGEFSGFRVGADLPFRLLIRCVEYFPEPVPEDLLFSTSAYERIFWIPFYRKIQGPRGCITIDPEAKQALLELLVKVNGAPQDHEFSPYYYDTELEGWSISLRMEGDHAQEDSADDQGLWLLNVPMVPGKPVSLEDHLRGWLLKHLDNPTHKDLRSIFGPVPHIEWFANNVPYHVAQRNIDLLIYHRTPSGELIEPSLRYKYSVVELKRDLVEPESIEQVVGYAKWVANRLANGEVDIVRPYIIARRFRPETMELARAIRFNRTGIQLVRYEVVGEDEIVFHPMM
jgi:hypothetical protein